MIRRLRQWIGQILVSLDQLLHVLIAGALYVAGRGERCPSADETISSRVGRAAMRGKRWGLATERVIDGLFVALGEAPGHCRRNVESAFLGLAPRP